MTTTKIKIHGGTARLGDPPLCRSCRYAAVVRGPGSRDEIIRCNRLESRITFHVTSCSVYLHQRHPSLWQMEDMAWVLRTEGRRGQIGFVRARDLPARQRHVLDED